MPTHLASPAEVAARAQLDELPDLTWSALTRDDLPDVAAMLERVYEHEDAAERQSLTDLQEYFDSPRSHPELHDLVGRDGSGAVVALAQSRPNDSATTERRVTLIGSVTPSRRGQGLGRAIMRWEIEHAKSWDAQTRQDGYGELSLSAYAEEAATDHQRLAERFGLPAVRWFTEMSRPLLPGESYDVPAVDGVDIVGWDPARSEQVRVAHNTAFADHWSTLPMDEQQWKEHITSHGFRPAWSLIALDGEEVVGYALNAAWEQDWQAGHRSGYTDGLGVLRSHRGRGLASALLLRSMRLFADDGMDAAELGVDTQNPSGAMGLYEHLGYRPTKRTVLHRATLPGQR
ncbi:GNAT family N-acetyltransferase [Calidifontibacter sp. DB0510]|uniref:GNAT family N-acetyltransferase n=1 Tax=Metallococcus carri TaxID=1656884 RepID=A0A967B5W9_9MICO|nr:GNAT family N-acetyltransferase [Metallococcus carri]NHN55226.1 GNAT family N-acetyltransferase [Metallococcus carri]NOP36303.1 GNAT family N-acetyltransferase [Calidifontibacter sp. DB2511S]